ncbi:MAG: hypothetical protein JRN57_04320 [Nitrososphaerota archaeon]|nr:hypothetical protein [Nitrososphaerota archaeon]
MGFGDYRFREIEAAIVHSHLVLLTYSLLLIMKGRLEKRAAAEHQEEEEKKRTYSLGEVCRIVRDTCLVSVCRWIQESLAAGLSLTKILGMIRPHIRTYK